MGLKLTNHTFVVCAYKDSPYLESCIRSLMGQSVPTNVKLCTSTPSQYIENIANKYKLKMVVKDGVSDIQEDWNFAYQLADTDLVTIAHQDDKYHKDYVASILNRYHKYSDMLITFTDYLVIKEKKILLREKSAMVKRLLLFPLRFTTLSHLFALKKCALAFGNAICCPSVTYNKKKLGEPLFTSNLKYGLDWDTFLKIAKIGGGRYIYIPKPLFYYRIHGEATSKKCILDKRRIREDEEMFRKIWPEWMTKVIMNLYQTSYDAYD